MKNTKGITLIALVITIIVLLILAGVSIAMLTGENGILTQASNAKQATDEANEQEKINIAVAGSRTDEGQISVEKLKEEIENQNGKVFGDSVPTTIQINDHLYRVNASGKVTQAIDGGTLDIVTGTETTNTTVQDALGNKIVVPVGFKIVNIKDYVTDGIIIEDVNHEETKGSQFVWIPVGNVKKEDNTTINIKLSRYTFADNGNPIDQGSNIITENFTEVNISEYGNITAKENIENEEAGFRKSAINNHGYYIGRYEARTNTKRTTSTSDDELTQATERPEEYVYDCVSQPQAAKLSREMYSSNNFKSDLMNSYAWDTTIVFFQEFDNRAQKTVPYSKQISLNSSIAYQGTNKLLEEGQKDVICNVYDIASNCYELTTETSIKDSRYPCVGRGGRYYNNFGCASYRGYDSFNFINDNYSFRNIIYM